MTDLYDSMDEDVFGAFGYEGAGKGKNDMKTMCCALTVILLLAIFYCVYFTMKNTTKSETMVGNTLLSDYTNRPRFYGARFDTPGRTGDLRSVTKGITLDEDKTEGFGNTGSTFLKYGNSMDTHWDGKADGERLREQIYSGN